MRKLVLLSLFFVLACNSCLTATAAAKADISRAPTPQFSEDAPRLLPMTPVERATGTAPTSGGELPADALAVIAALYWLVLGGIALRRNLRTSPLRL